MNEPRCGKDLLIWPSLLKYAPLALDSQDILQNPMLGPSFLSGCFQKPDRSPNPVSVEFTCSVAETSSQLVTEDVARWFGELDGTEAGSQKVAVGVQYFASGHYFRALILYLMPEKMHREKVKTKACHRARTATPTAGTLHCRYLGCVLL
jgi:hypothetical protein